MISKITIREHGAFWCKGFRTQEIENVFISLCGCRDLPTSERWFSIHIKGKVYETRGVDFPLCFVDFALFAAAMRIEPQEPDQ